MEFLTLYCHSTFVCDYVTYVSLLLVSGQTWDFSKFRWRRKSYLDCTLWGKSIQWALRRSSCWPLLDSEDFTQSLSLSAVYSYKTQSPDAEWWTPQGETGKLSFFFAQKSIKAKSNESHKFKQQIEVELCVGQPKELTLPVLSYWPDFQHADLSFSMNVLIVCQRVVDRKQLVDNVDAVKDISEFSPICILIVIYYWMMSMNRAMNLQQYTVSFCSRNEIVWYMSLKVIA